MVQAPCQTPEAGHPATTSQPAVAACPPAKPAPQTVGVDPAAVAALPGPAIGWQASRPRRHTRIGRPRTSGPCAATAGNAGQHGSAAAGKQLRWFGRGAVTQRPLLPQLPACERACVLALARRVFVYMLETLSFQLLEPLPITNTAPMPK